MNNKITILHITADFPDCFNPNKTSAVQSLVSASRHDSVIISINRKAIFPEAVAINNNVISIQYFALPLGIGSSFFLKRLAHKILNVIDKERLEFDLIHAHKFSIEGVIAYHISKANKKPYLTSLWGSTDRKIMSVKKASKKLFRSVAYNSKIILPASPWIAEWTKKELTLEPTVIFHTLPIITKNTEQLNKSPNTTPFKLVSVFNLDLYKLKGLPNLLTALSKIESVTLDIYGEGSTQSKIKKLIKKNNLEDRVSLCGYIENDMIIDTLSQYNAFVMTTKNETFGMVYIEALSAGLPIIYSQEQGIDGYFEHRDIGVKVNPKAVNSIASGINEIIQNYDALKRNVLASHEGGDLGKFNTASIANQYDTIINDVFIR